MYTDCLLLLDILTSQAGLQGAGGCTPLPMAFTPSTLGTGSHPRLVSFGSGFLN